jgi:hypothetical protein
VSGSATPGGTGCPARGSIAPGAALGRPLRGSTFDIGGGGVVGSVGGLADGELNGLSMPVGGVLGRDSVVSGIVPGGGVVVLGGIDPGGGGVAGRGAEPGDSIAVPGSGPMTPGSAPVVPGGVGGGAVPPPWAAAAAASAIAIGTPSPSCSAFIDPSSSRLDDPSKDGAGVSGRAKQDRAEERLGA